MKISTLLDLAVVMTLVSIHAASPARASAPESAKICTEDAFTVDRGATEVQVTYQGVRAYQSFDSYNHLVDRAYNRINAVYASVTYGLANRLDAAVGIDWAQLVDNAVRVRYGNGIGNAGLRLKWTFAQKGPWGFAYLGGVTAPVGQKPDESELGIAQDSWSFDQLLVATSSAGRISVTADLGYRAAFWSDDPNTHGGVSTNAAVGYQVAGWLQPIVEVNFAHDYVRIVSDPYLLATTVGAVVNANNAFRVDLGVQYGVFGRDTDRAVAATLNLSYTL